MSRESSIAQIESERVSLEQQVALERGPDEIIAAPNPGVIVFPSDGPTKFPLGLSGSLTKLTSGEDYLVPGSNIILTTASNGSIVISSEGGGAEPGGSDTHVQFNDGGAALGGSSSFTFNKATNTLKVTNLSGSLTKLASGEDYLVAGQGITLSTGSNGSVTIGTALGWQSYVPNITAVVNPTLPTSHNLFGRYFIRGKVLTLLFSLSWNSSDGALPGTGAYNISLPNGVLIDTAIAAAGSAPTFVAGTSLGPASLIADLVGTGGGWAVIPSSTSTLVLVGQNPNSASQPLVWGSDIFYIGQSQEARISFLITVPIV